MVKKITFLVVWSILIFVGSVSAQKVTLAYVDFPPYEFEENGKPQGILVKIVERLFEKANISLELEFLPFKRAYIEVKQGKIDGLFNFYKIEERLKYFDYTDAIIENPLVFFVRKDSTLQYKGLKNLKGLKIGVMRGYSYGSEFDNSTFFEKDPSNSHIANFKKLLYGRFDAYPCDKLVGIYVARQNNMMSEFKILPTPLTVMDGHIGFTKGRHQDIIKKINIELKAMQTHGGIDKLINQYFENF
jgi:polar amino acid transport system substrate-binding protein